jgi:hypothetical protein
VDVEDRYIPLAAFDRTDICSMDPRPCGKGFLTELALSPEGPNRVAEASECITASCGVHAPTVAAMMPMRRQTISSDGDQIRRTTV